MVNLPPFRLAVINETSYQTDIIPTLRGFLSTREDLSRIQLSTGDSVTEATLEPDPDCVLILSEQNQDDLTTPQSDADGTSEGKSTENDSPDSANISSESDTETPPEDSDTASDEESSPETPDGGQATTSPQDGDDSDDGKRDTPYQTIDSQLEFLQEHVSGVPIIIIGPRDAHESSDTLADVETEHGPIYYIKHTDAELTQQLLKHKLTTIIEQYNYDKRLQQHKEYIRHSPTLLLTLDIETTVIDQRQTKPSITEHPVPTYEGQKLTNFIHPDDRETLTEALTTVSETGADRDVVEIRLRTPHNAENAVDTLPHPTDGGIADDGGEHGAEHSGSEDDPVPIPDPDQVADTETPTDPSQEVNIITPPESDIEPSKSPPEPSDSDSRESEPTQTHLDDVLDTSSEWEWFEACIQNLYNNDYINGYLVTLQHITHRKRYEDQLQEQLNNISILNKVVRHDIRNDLQLISAYLELLDGHVSDDNQKQVTRALQSISSAVELTETAKDLGETMMAVNPDTRPMNIRPFLIDQVESVQSRRPSVFVSIRDSIPTTRVIANQMVESVFRNVLQNAVKHNDKDDPEITISAAEREDTLMINIADNGPGINPELRDEIFNEGAKGIQSSGSGLGLYLVQTVMDDFDGEIAVKDNNPRGTIIELTFNKEVQTQD